MSFQSLIDRALHLGAEQDPDELEWLIAQLDPPPRRILEIGVRRGGLLWLWQNLYPDAAVFGLDLNEPPCWWCDRGLAHSGCPRRPRGGVTIVGDSTAQSTIDRVGRIVHAGGPFDLLYIDGDHEAAGVRADFFNYAPFVRPGGWVAFHDATSELWPAVGSFVYGLPAAATATFQGQRGGMGTALYSK